jgi:hypothetical protein
VFPEGERGKKELLVETTVSEDVLKTCVSVEYMTKDDVGSGDFE